LLDTASSRSRNVSYPNPQPLITLYHPLLFRSIHIDSILLIIPLTIQVSESQHPTIVSYLSVLSCYF